MKAELSASPAGTADQPERVFEFAVEFGFRFKYFEVPASTETAARDKLWDEVLTCDQRDAVSSIECLDQRAA